MPRGELVEWHESWGGLGSKSRDIGVFAEDSRAIRAGPSQLMLQRPKEQAR